MNCQAERLFVYGTLMPGQSRYRLIERYVHSTRPGMIQGILVDLGAFPALVPGEGIVKGTILDVDPVAISVTDRIEGYEADRKSCLYLRKSVSVTLGNGQTETAWTYEYANPDSIADRPTLEVGDNDDIPTYAWPPVG